MFLSEQDKYQAVIEDIEECVKRGQPVLVGTTSIETSELLATLLTRQDPARGAERQATRARGAIVAQAGRPVRSPSPPTWRAAAPTSCWAAARDARSTPCRIRRRRPHAERSGGMANPPRAGNRQPAACTSSAPNAMSRGASTTSCAAVGSPGRPRLQPLLSVAGR